MNKKRLWKLITETLGSATLHGFYSGSGCGAEADIHAGRRRNAEKEIKEMLDIPEYHYSGENCPRCKGYLWWDGTCSDCEYKKEV